MSIAFLFPGQGSQTPGMGKSLFDASPAAKKRFQQADEILGRSLSALCFEGPEEDLKQTRNTQPALYVVSAAACDALREADVAPAFVAGHSLGEYAALYAAGAFDFETGLRLVAARAEAMAEAGAATPGAMAAIIGLSIEQVEAVCKKAAESDSASVGVANDNAPGQTVVSGTPEGIDRACALAKEAGAKRALPLPVSGAFHSSLVASAQNVMRERLAEAEIRPPQCTFVPNVTAEPESDPEAIRRLLVEQIVSRVRWVESVRRLRELGAEKAFEAGPGKVLAGLVRRIDKELQVLPAGTAEDVAALKS